jgi:NADH-quinone oxidoreductase subunit J
MFLKLPPPSSKMQTLHIVLNFTLATSALLVLTADNPVHSVLFLILTFCNASAILLLFKLEFLALVFVMIYVGAIAVLFLFVVMMLNIKVVNTKGVFSFQTFLIFLISFGLFVLIYAIVEQSFFGFKDPMYFEFSEEMLFGSTNLHFRNMDCLSNIDVVGQVLYNYFTPCFLMGGLLLLIAMIGAIVLTLNFNSDRRNELFYRQLSRSDNFLSFLK